MSDKIIKVTLRRSPIGTSPRQRLTLRGLGLKRLGGSVIVKDSAAVRGIENPAFCKKGSDHPSAKAFPVERSGRQAAVLDPKTMKYSPIDTCFGTHHPQFGYDADDTLWFSGTVPVAPLTLATMRAMLERPLNEFHRADFPADLRRDLSRALVPYIRHRLDAPLKSLQFIEDVTADPVLD